MTEEKSSYRQILKATSIFGGVQVFNIVIQIVRAKVLAILLGPAGMGINGLLSSTLSFMGSITSFGLGTSAVKNIAEAQASQNEEQISIVNTVLRRLIWFTGILGAILTIVLSPILSQWTFGNKDFSFAFIWLSVSLLFNQLSSGYLVVLQGLRKLNYLANANITGSFLGLFVSVPIYYVWGNDGIVPAILVTSVVSMLRAWYFGNKVKIQDVKVSHSVTLKVGKEMLKMGVMLSLSGLITTAAAYFLRIYINNAGGVEQVGFYSAGFAIIESYVGLIFVAMGTDYFPRLSAINKNIEKIRDVVTQQSVIALLVLTPIIILFIVFSPVAISILYSSEFISIENMVKWGVLGMLFRAVSWSMGFLLLAKSDSKVFIKTAIGFNALFLINNVVGYKYYGLTGLGVSFLINYVIHFAVLLVITKIRYQFYFRKELYYVMLVGGLFCLGGLAFSTIETDWLRFLLGTCMAMAAAIFSFSELNRRIGIGDSIKNIIVRKR